MRIMKMRKRRTYLIKNSSQPRLIIGFQVIFFLVAILGAAIFYWMTSRDLGETYASAHVTIRNVSEILLPTIIILNILGAALSIVASIFFTHRIAGPAFNLQRALEDIGQGNLARRVVFRKNDELKELAEAANEMVSGLNRRLHPLLVEGRAVLDRSQQVLKVVDSGSPDCAAVQVARSVAGNNGDLAVALTRFKSQLERTGAACPVSGHVVVLAEKVASLEKELESLRLHQDVAPSADYTN